MISHGDMHAIVLKHYGQMFMDRWDWPDDQAISVLEEVYDRACTDISDLFRKGNGKDKCLKMRHRG